MRDRGNMQPQRPLQPPYEMRRIGLLGVIHQIYALPLHFDASKLSELVATDRLAVSQDGHHVALIARVTDSMERIAHNFERMASSRFCSHENGVRIETRILHVGTDRLLVWGLPFGQSVRGVYELKVGRPRLKLVRPFAELHRVCRLPHGMFLLGVGTEDSEAKHVWTEHGVLPVEDLATATSVSDGSFLFLEQIDGNSYRYRFGARGFVDWFPVLHPQGEVPVALAYVQNQYVLATRTESGSRLRVVGSANTLTFPLAENWMGDIEQLWVSPSERSLAWLVRPDRSNSSRRELYLNGQLIHEGEFSMNQADLVWAPLGPSLGARITTQDASGQERQSIITQDTQREFPTGTFLREFLIDTDGGIAATITDDGELCYPVMYDRSLQSVPIAWGLHWASSGGIGYSSVLPESIVCLTVDETDLLRH